MHWLFHPPFRRIFPSVVRRNCGADLFLSRGLTTPSSVWNTDTLIIGGGPIGSSTAYHLAKSRNCDGRGIVVIEKDPTYSRASATLSAGGIRQQFSLKENVQMSLYGRDFLRNAKELLGPEVDVQFQEHGYLFLAGSKRGMEQMVKNHDVQVSAGATDIELLNETDLALKFPWLRTDDLLMGSYGTKGEGWFDPWALIRGLKEKCSNMGVKYLHGRPVAAKRNAETGRVLSVDVEHLGKDGFGVDEMVTHNINSVVNAAGAQASFLMDLLATQRMPLYYQLPVRPRKRCIFFFHCSAKEGVPPVAPLTVDPLTLVYFRSEGSVDAGNFICGVSPPQEMDSDCHGDSCFEVIDHHLFDDTIWPALYHRVPAFGEIKVKSSWAGLYEYNTIDQNGVIDFHPEMPNVLMLNGFSGHGLQQSPAAGRAGSELIETGRFQTLDLGIFSFHRLMEGGEPVFEQAIV